MAPAPPAGEGDARPRGRVMPGRELTTLDSLKLSELWKRGNGNRNGWKKWLLAIAGALAIAFFTWTGSELMKAHDLQQRVVLPTSKESGA